jgi:CheY-like chemotaxis protein
LNPENKPLVLIVDDNPQNLQVLGNLLRDNGYKVAAAQNGALALDFVHTHQPECILLDIMMPEIDGIEICRKLKTQETTSDIPVLFITGLAETQHKIEAFEAGGVDYITKPFQAQEILVRVKTQIALRDMHKRLQTKNAQLEQEIEERRRVEQALWHHNRDLSLFDSLSKALQACRTETETYAVIANICEQLFPWDSGYIALLDDTHTMLQEAASWGDYPSSPRRAFPIDTCQGLRHVQETGMVEEVSSEQSCAHFDALGETAQEHLCIPIGAPQEILGIFAMLIGHRIIPSPTPQKKHKIGLQRMLAIRLVEHYALTLTNLRLRETLRLESIHDPLTGL